MFQAKFAIIKCVTALVIALTSVTALVAYASVDSVNTVIIVDGDTKCEVTTHCATADEILLEQNIVLKEGDTANLDLKDGVGSLKINRSFPVHITVGNKTVSVEMQQGTVETALKLANITLGKYDLCNKKIDEVLSQETYIDIMSVDYTTESRTEIIPFATKVEYSNKLEKGKKQVINGTNGTKIVTVRKTVENGKVTGEEVISEEITTEAKPQTTIIGTKTAQKSAAAVKTISSLGSVEVDSKGVPLKYKKSMTFKASAYTSNQGAKCSTGVTAKPGYIAVNPNVIPYGTKMYITSNDGKYVYGYAIAADTGGFAKRNPYMVDLYFNTKSECTNFGIRNVTIYILE